MNKTFYVYIMSSPNGQVIYTGVTNNLVKRIFEHKSKLVPRFTAKYNVIKLVHYEIYETAYQAISREKQIKAGPRTKKVNLIESKNKEWDDLYKEICQ